MRLVTKAKNWLKIGLLLCMALLAAAATLAGDGGTYASYDSYDSYGSYTPTGELGTLTISKTVTGAGAETDKKFTFTITLTDDHGNALAGAYNYTYTKGGEGGEITSGNPVTLKGGESVTIKGIPKGTEYTVTETSMDGYTSNHRDGKATGTVDGGTAEVQFINTKEPDNPPPDDPPPSTPSKRYGTYKYVHEYYYKDANGDLTLEGTSSVATSSRVELPDDTRYTQADVTKVYTHKGNTYEYDSDAYGKISGGKWSETAGKTYVTATGSGDQIIILKYVRSDDPAAGGYKVVHEYYYRAADGAETLEGRSGIRSVDGLPLDDTQYTAAGVTQEPVFDGRAYTYENAAYGMMAGGSEYGPDGAMEYVISTENGEQIIILRYVREETKPSDPDRPTDLPDPNDPDSPDEITIWDEDVPKGYIKVWDPEKEEWVYVPEFDVPLADITVWDPEQSDRVTIPELITEEITLDSGVPWTGDDSHIAMWGAIAVLSGIGSFALMMAEKKRKDVLD